MANLLKKLRKDNGKYIDTIVLDAGGRICRFEGITEDAEDVYYKQRDMNGKLVLSSCVGRIVPLKGKISDDDYEYLENLFELNWVD